MRWLKGLSVAAVLWSTLALGMWKGGYGAWFLFYGLLLLTGGQWAALTLQGKVETVERKTRSFFTEGDTVTVEVMVKCSGRFPVLWLNVRDEWHSRWLSPWTAAIIRYSYEIPSAARAVYESETVEVRIEDMLGWWSRRKKIGSPVRFAVVPAPEPLPVRAFAPPFGMEPGDLRLYRDGDAIRLVHWKQSVRRNRRVVRTEAPVAPNVWILAVEGDAGTWRARFAERFGPAFERGVRLAAGFYRRMASHAAVGLVMGGGDMYVPPVRNNEIRMMEALASLRTGKGEPFRQVLERRVFQADRSISVCVLSPYLSRDLEQALQAMRRQGRAVILVMPGPAGFREDEKLRMERLHRSGCRIALPKTGIRGPGGGDLHA